MREQRLISTKQVNTECGEVLHLEYYLTSKDSVEEEGKVYGISIENHHGDRVETDVVENISYKEEQVLEFVHILSENTVTPICMAEILDDIMTERMYS